MAKTFKPRKITTEAEAREFLDWLREEIARAPDIPEGRVTAAYDFDLLGIDGTQHVAMSLDGVKSTAAFYERFVDIDPVRMALSVVVHWLRWSQDDVGEFLELSKGRISQYMNSDDPIPMGRAHEIHGMLSAGLLGWQAVSDTQRQMLEILPDRAEISENRALAAEHIKQACQAILADLTEYLDGEDRAA